MVFADLTTMCRVQIFVIWHDAGLKAVKRSVSKPEHFIFYIILFLSKYWKFDLQYILWRFDNNEIVSFNVFTLNTYINKWFVAIAFQKVMPFWAAGWLLDLVLMVFLPGKIRKIKWMVFRNKLRELEYPEFDFYSFKSPQFLRT